MGLTRLQARLGEFLPNPPLTRDQLLMLQRDNVQAPGTLGLADLGIRPEGAGGGGAELPHPLPDGRRTPAFGRVKGPIRTCFANLRLRYVTRLPLSLRKCRPSLPILR